MRSEFVTRTQTLLLHEDEDGVRPTSGMELLTMGSFAVAYSLRGAGFYKLLEESGLEPFRQIGVDTVLAAVSPVHLRAMRQRLKGVTVRELQTINVGGKAFHLVMVTMRMSSGEPLGLAHIRAPHQFDGSAEQAGAALATL